MAAKFEIFLDRKKQYRFHLKASNGEIIAAGSEGYETKAACVKGIKSIQNNAPKAVVIDLNAEKKAIESKKTANKPKSAVIAKPRGRNAEEK
jgi:uncharacterized protein YegP (UPF0339 family)